MILLIKESNKKTCYGQFNNLNKNNFFKIMLSRN